MQGPARKKALQPVDSDLMAALVAALGLCTWLVMFCSIMNCLEMTCICSHVVSVVLGLYLAECFPVIYIVLSLGLAITQAAEVSIPKHFRPVLQRIQIYTKKQQVSPVFMLWCPKMLPFWWIHRFTSLVFMLGVLHMVLMLTCDLDDCTDIVSLWHCLRQHGRSSKFMATLLGASLLFLVGSFCMHPAVMILVLLLLAVVTSYAVWKDTELGETLQAALRKILECAGCHDDLDWIFERLELAFTARFYTSLTAFHRLQRRLQESESKDCLIWFWPGLASTLLMTLVSWTVASLVSPVFMCALTSFLCGLAAQLSQSRGAMFGLGALTVLTMERVLTGCVFGVRVASVLSIWLILWDVIAKLLWAWCAGFLVTAHLAFYLGSPFLCGVVFEMWVAYESQGGSVDLVVPHDQDEILLSTLRSLPADCSKWHVQFVGGGDFLLDQVDVGGLSKELCTMMAKSMVTSDKYRAWPLCMKWDDASQVYHLNYEAFQMQSQEAQFRVLASNCGHEIELDGLSGEDVFEMCQQLGVFIGKCLMQGYPLLRFSKAMIKYLLRNRDSDLPITFEDMQELLPDMAGNMQRSKDLFVEGL